MKRVILLLILLGTIVSFGYSQSIVASCQARNTKTFEDFYTECFVNFDISQRTIRVTFPKVKSLNLKEVNSLSSGRVTFSAKGSDGYNYKLYFFDVSGLAGSPTMTLRIEREPSIKSEFNYTYFLDPDTIIPILNKILARM